MPDSFACQGEDPRSDQESKEEIVGQNFNENIHQHQASGPPKTGLYTCKLRLKDLITIKFEPPAAA